MVLYDYLENITVDGYSYSNGYSYYVQLDLPSVNIKRFYR